MTKTDSQKVRHSHTSLFNSINYISKSDLNSVEAGSRPYFNLMFIYLVIELNLLATDLSMLLLYNQAHQFARTASKL